MRLLLDYRKFAQQHEDWQPAAVRSRVIMSKDNAAVNREESLARDRHVSGAEIMREPSRHLP